ncbi:LPD7 domain-containing protein [Caminibacter pacificus]
MKRKVKSSIHIVKANIYFILHSIRANASYSVVFTDEENEYLYDKDTALKKFRDELKKREFEYTKRTGKKLPKNTAFLLSAIVNLHQHHTLKDLDPIVNYLEKTLDTKVVSVVIHRDEGKLVNKTTGEEFYSGADFIKGEDGKLYWIDENKKIKEEVNLEEFEIVKNYHAHIEFIGLDSTGRSIKRNRLNKYYLSKLQDFVADTLKMQRGFSYYKENKKAPKRLDVKEFKKIGVAKREGARLARVKDLKEENKLLREELQKLGAQREDYAELEALVKELKEKIKQKDLTIIELVERLEEYKKKIYSKYVHKETKKRLTHEELAEHYKERLDKALQAQKTLSDRVNTLKNENDVLKASKDVLEEENKKLKEELEFYRQKAPIAQVSVKYENSEGFSLPQEYIDYISKLKESDFVKEITPEVDNKYKIKKVTIETKTGTIVDTGNTISIKSLSIKEDVKIALDLAEAKGWKLDEIEVEGSEEFKKLVEKEIQERLKSKKLDFNFDFNWEREEQTEKETYKTYTKSKFKR